MKALHVLSCPGMEPLISHKSTSPPYIPKLGVILKPTEDVAQEQRTFLQYALSLFLTTPYVCAWLIQGRKNALSTQTPFRKSFIIVFSRGSSYERASFNPFWVSVFRRSLNHRALDNHSPYGTLLPPHARPQAPCGLCLQLAASGCLLWQCTDLPLKHRLQTKMAASSLISLLLYSACSTASWVQRQLQGLRRTAQCQMRVQDIYEHHRKQLHVWYHQRVNQCVGSQYETHRRCHVTLSSLSKQSKLGPRQEVEAGNSPRLQRGK